MSRDLRHALRRPGFILGSSLILGLALGANVAAFAILYGYLFRPLPYAAPGELFVPREQVLKWHLLGPQVSPHFFDMVRQLPQFRDAALWSPDDARVEVNGTSALEGFGQVTPTTFTLLGVKPLLGRTLSFASGSSPASAGSLYSSPYLVFTPWSRTALACGFSSWPSAKCSAPPAGKYCE